MYRFHGNVIFQSHNQTIFHTLKLQTHTHTHTHIYIYTSNTPHRFLCPPNWSTQIEHLQNNISVFLCAKKKINGPQKLNLIAHVENTRECPHALANQLPALNMCNEVCKPLCLTVSSVLCHGIYSVHHGCSYQIISA